jgi:hypothetical protein
VVSEKDRVLTAAHCIPVGLERLTVKLKGGSRIESTLEYLDRESDLALLRLDAPAAVEPLMFASVLPSAGQPVLFAGRVDRRSRSQVARVERLGTCPSLPGVEKAVFTTLQAKPGDSGAPIVNRDLRVVGVIHGGAACHIAAPTVELGRKLARGELPAFRPEVPRDLASAFEPAHERTPTKSYKAGPFVFDTYPHGFRFRWSAKWGFGQGR